MRTLASFRTAAVTTTLGATLWALACVAGPAAAAPAAASEGLGVPGARAAELLRHHALRRLDGRAWTLAESRGDVVVVDFWATWCGPCRKEMPRLDALNTELAKHGGRVVAISIDEDGENISRFVREHGLKLAVLQDGPNGLARELALQHVPMTLVLDRNGEVAYASSRSDEAGTAAVAAFARQLLDTRPVAASLQEGAQR